MKHTRILLTCIVALVPVFVARPGIAAAPPAPEATVDLVVDVRTIAGKAALDLEAQDFEVRESGKSMTVMEVRPLTGRAEPWRIVIYLDPAFVHPASLPSTAQALAGRAEELAALGTVEVVRAVTRPHHRLETSREPEAIRTALYSLPFPVSQRGSVAELRQAFLDGAGETDPEALGDRVRQSARQELALASERLQVLRHWIATQPTNATPTALLWVTDGFDVSMTEFYDRASNRRLHRDITNALASYGLEDELEDLVRELVMSGWTTLPLARRGGAAATPRPVAPWIDGLKPLRLTAVHTGGTVLSPEQASEVTRNLARRWLVTCRVEEGTAGEAPQRIDVAVHRDGVVVHGALWRGRPSKVDLSGGVESRPSVAALDAGAR